MNSDTTDPNLANNSDTVTTLTATQADLSATATTAARFAIAGTTITYTITLANAGPSDALNVVGTAVMPANTTFVSGGQTSGPAFTIANPPDGGLATIVASIATLDPGVSATFALVLLVSPSTPDGTNFTSTGTITSSTLDPNPSNNYQSNTFVSGTLADVSVTNTLAAGPANPGGTVAYTVTVANSGPSDAQTVALSDNLPANTTFVSAGQTSGPVFNLAVPTVGGTGAITATLGTMAAGATASFTVVVMVPPATAVGTAITNTATVTSATSSLNLANTSQIVTTNVLAPVVPPAVVDLKRFGSNSQPTILVLWFSLPLDSVAAQNVANYRIVMLGGSGAGSSRGGQVIRVTKAVYNAAAQTVTLHLANRLLLQNLYQITATGTAPGGLVGTDGARLDGAGNGTPGSNFVGLLSRKTLAGPSAKAKRASQTSEAGGTPLVAPRDSDGRRQPGGCRTTPSRASPDGGSVTWRETVGRRRFH